MLDKRRQFEGGVVAERGNVVNDRHSVNLSCSRVGNANRIGAMLLYKLFDFLCVVKRRQLDISIVTALALVVFVIFENSRLAPEFL